MKYNILYLISCLLLLGGIVSCSDDEKQAVYLPQGQKTLSSVFSITDEPYVLKYVATLVGSDFATVHDVASKDITIEFEVDMSLVESYNKDCETNYLEMPAGTYRIPQSATIEKGSNSTDSLEIIISAKDKFESFVPYLLPIRISKIDGAKAYQYQQVIYVAVSGVADAENIQNYDRTDWEIIDLSSEEPGEGGGNGLGVCILDDKPNTYWHTKWAGGEPEPPHHITIDMKETQVLHGISLMNRYFEGSWATDGHGQPKNIKISVSLDGETWKENGEFKNLPHPEGQIDISTLQFISQYASRT